MKTLRENPSYNDLCALCSLIRDLASEENYDLCIKELSVAMQNHPHAPQPHNLMGVVLEKSGDHLSAMKHFRAAWALDPTYLPARHNLNTYGTFFSFGKCAFDESDVPTEPAPDTNQYLASGLPDVF